MRLWRYKEPLYLLLGWQNGSTIMKTMKATQKLKIENIELSYDLPISHFVFIQHNLFFFFTMCLNIMVGAWKGEGHCTQGLMADGLLSRGVIVFLSVWNCENHITSVHYKATALTKPWIPHVWEFGFHYTCRVNYFKIHLFERYHPETVAVLGVMESLFYFL